MAIKFKATVSSEGQFYISNPQSGYTLLAFKDGKRMMRVSVAWCSHADKFKRKKGKAIAGARFINGESVLVPIADIGTDSIIDTLRDAFDILST